MVRFHCFYLTTCTEFINENERFVSEIWVLNLKNLLGGGRPGRIVILQESDRRKHLSVRTSLINQEIIRIYGQCHASESLVLCSSDLIKECSFALPLKVCAWYRALGDAWCSWEVCKCFVRVWVWLSSLQWFKNGLYVARSSSWGR